MSLVEHAERELRRCGQMEEDPEYTAAIIAAVKAFVSYGHSGGSAMVARWQLNDLLQFRTLSPLTSDPSEWQDRSDISSSPLWQNRRDPAAMSGDGGQTWYFVDGRDKEPHGYSKAIEALEDTGRLNLWLQAEATDESVDLNTVEAVVRYLRALEGGTDD